MTVSWIPIITGSVFCSHGSGFIVDWDHEEYAYRKFHEGAVSCYTDKTRDIIQMLIRIMFIIKSLRVLASRTNGSWQEDKELEGYLHGHLVRLSKRNIYLVDWDMKKTTTSQALPNNSPSSIRRYLLQTVIISYFHGMS